MKRGFRIVICILACLIIVYIYYFFDPKVTQWMPKCAFKLLTGMDCPACGNQRALHSLLHREFSEAFQDNPFFILSLPYMVLLVVSWKSNFGVLVKIRSIVQSRVVVSVYVVAICCWWILRNVLK